MNRKFSPGTRDLEADGVIHRGMYPVVPPKVEYCLTELGETIIPNILSLAQWGRQVGKKIE